VAVRKTVLFLIRDKLGDSLIAANVALQFARRRPDWDVAVMIRRAYAFPLAHEPEIEIVPYRSGVQIRLLTWWWWLRRRKFDVLGVMRGFGGRALALIRSIPARRVVVHDGRLATLATEVVGSCENPGEDPHYGPAWRVARALDRDLPEPTDLRFPGLIKRWEKAPKRFVAVCPLSDELRRNMPALAIEALCDTLQLRYPDRQVLVLVRQHADLRAYPQPPQVAITEFRTLPRLIELLGQCSHFFGTDTGLLHLAMAMGLPSTVFFGPTQPHRVLPVNQAKIVALRSSALGDRHCDIKSCTSALCIAQAVAIYAAGKETLCEPSTPGCPLKGT